MKSFIILEIILASSAGQSYWWLDNPGVFGGRNYDSEAIASGEHLRNRSAATSTNPIDRVKRQSNILPDDITSECPIDSNCVERYLCRTKAPSRLDLIPCYVPAENNFGVCCTNPFPRICPFTPNIPTREQCKFAEKECNSPGDESGCERPALCCFNGCTNVCLKKSYFEPQRPFFTRLPPRDKQKRPSVTSQSTEGPNSKPVRTTRGPKITTTAPELNTARVTEETTPRTEDDFSEYESNSDDYNDFGIDARIGPSRSSPRREGGTTKGGTTRGPKTGIVTKGTELSQSFESLQKEEPRDLEKLWSKLLDRLLTLEK
ncbi:uncharacterized protein LOC111696999 [Eurytemora carolleeae]|uniref:uncharacterized protein LOC111696999 n=1 Tax=Eurytemora carolleeae TaxID=1294199 RepID=UPI000C75FDB8|nr:uncharacterized protein LOC111696999 [Eurytemora carolleeae]XP_023322619.1 uncharacterized protein LOC111696999 [Eurytemora carolleeae]|eukprot:XP_023322618.1 uncharacterized protein LOC111696999 [Eurytemora affinis]